MTNTLSAPTIIRNVETYLAQQYAKRQPQRVTVERHPADGVIVILVWCVVVLMTWK